MKIAQLPEMNSETAVEIARLFDQNQIEFYNDGGWCVDALLGEQTRSHSDLDIAVQHQDAPNIRALLAEWG